ncbi:hypothetical protein KP509_01G010500 [Ceratopteris richardii]|uniref:Uncharacterized protein n=1 Tax=Ceratopteris richardii TaxID=49495 RepID=A0A8T2VI16_CERRI|nr:hypothetical protein KP509_01G010500 [Ceratopteris richardii]
MRLPMQVKDVMVQRAPTSAAVIIDCPHIHSSSCNSERYTRCVVYENVQNSRSFPYINGVPPDENYGTDHFGDDFRSGAFLARCLLFITVLGWYHPPKTAAQMIPLTDLIGMVTVSVCAYLQHCMKF